MRRCGLPDRKAPHPAWSWGRHEAGGHCGPCQRQEPSTEGPCSAVAAGPSAAWLGSPIDGLLRVSGGDGWNQLPRGSGTLEPEGSVRTPPRGHTRPRVLKQAGSRPAPSWDGGVRADPGPASCPPSTTAATGLDGAFLAGSCRPLRAPLSTGGDDQGEALAPGPQSRWGQSGPSLSLVLRHTKQPAPSDSHDRNVSHPPPIRGAGGGPSVPRTAPAPPGSRRPVHG